MSQPTTTRKAVNQPSTLQALFACAQYHGTTLSEAAKLLDVNQEALKEAVMFRLAVSDKGTEYETDYKATIHEGLRRLANAN